MQPRQTLRRVKSLLVSPAGTVLLVEGAILLAAALLRIWALDLKPPHFDEGINGWFVDQMRQNGFYRYDPENYHGPFYFYLLFAFLSLFGRNLWALRLPAVLASIASVWMALRFDRFLGSAAARWGAASLALSPAAVFYGRYAIHESWVVLALLITAWGLLGLWKENGRRDLAVTLTGITLLLLLKETAIIHLGCFLIAGCILFGWEKLVPSCPSLPLASRSWTRDDLLRGLSLSALALVFFYSGTFLNWGGLPDFVKAYLKWFQTGIGEGGHVKGEYQVGSLNYYWLALMAHYEWPALLGLAYTVRLAWPASAPVRYLGIYAAGVLLAYTIVPYKTPWCIISILWPFSLLFGCACRELESRLSPGVFRRIARLLLLGVLGVSLMMAFRLNFRNSVNPKEPYVYVQTLPEITRLTDPVLGMAARDPVNHAISGQILLESYYPLPWILGDFTRIGYYGKEEMPAALAGDFIVALSARQAEVEGKIREPYLRRRFHLRDSMEECTVWFREAQFRPWFGEAGHGATERVVPALPKK